MNGIEAVKAIMKAEGETSPKLAVKLGYTTPSGVTEKLRGKHDRRVDTFAKFLNTMGYEIVVRKIGETDGIVIGDSATPSI